MKRTTLKDIAKLTGLSISGVSKALSNHPGIGQETREKVKEVAAALNFHPNPSAQLLRTKNSKIIAAILPQINTFFFPELLQGISKVVGQHGCSLTYLQSDDSLQKEMELADYCLQMFAEGVLVSLSVETSGIGHLLKLQEAGTPVLLIDRVLENGQIPYLTIDERETAFKAVDYLVKKGHKHILGVFDDPRLSMSQLRAEGFRQAHAENGLELDASQVLLSPDDRQKEEIAALLDEHPSATAVFTMSDKLLVKTCHLINSMGFKMPDDIALISISDGKAPYYLHPGGITHLHHSGEEVGSAAARLLFEMMQGKTAVQGFHKIETSLVQLASA